MASLHEVVRDLLLLSDEAREIQLYPDDVETIFVPLREVDVSENTPTLVSLEEEPPEGWRYFLEKFVALEAIEVWSAWRSNRTPTTREACEAIIHDADYDAYLEDQPRS